MFERGVRYNERFWKGKKGAISIHRRKCAYTLFKHTPYY